jgi:hypothetical protein
MVIRGRLRIQQPSYLIIIIIIITFVNCKCVDTHPVDTHPVDTHPVDTHPVDTHPVDTRPVDTHPVAVVISHITYARTVKVDYSRVSWGGLHGTHVVETGKGKTGTITAFALGPRKTKKNLCRDDRSQDLPATDL